MFKGLKAGDRVYVGLHRGGGEWTVEKVGRKYFIAGRSEFRLEDGTSTSGYSYPRASTLEAHAFEARVKKAREELTAFGVRLDYATAAEKILVVYDALRPQMPAAPSESKAGT